MYVGAVDAGWTADVAKNALPALTVKRNEYNTKAQVKTAAFLAGDKYLSSGTPIAGGIKTHCADEFAQTFGFAHVDRWIMTHQDKASALQGAQTNLNWCEGTFWAKNKQEFAVRFHDYAKAKLCPGAAGPRPSACVTASSD